MAKSVRPKHCFDPSKTAMESALELPPLGLAHLHEPHQFGLFLRRVNLNDAFPHGSTEGGCVSTGKVINASNSALSSEISNSPSIDFALKLTGSTLVMTDSRAMNCPSFFNLSSTSLHYSILSK
jgi:hypothetical protein